MYNFMNNVPSTAMINVVYKHTYIKTRYFVVVIVWCNVYKTKIFNHLPTNVLLDCIHTYIFN